MKKIISIFTFIAILASCSKDNSGNNNSGANNNPSGKSISLNDVSNLTCSSGTFGLSFSGFTFKPENELGILIEKTANPTLNPNSFGDTFQLISGKTSYSKTIDGLEPNTKYYYRAFYLYSGVAVYSDVKELTTPACGGGGGGTNTGILGIWMTYRNNFPNTTMDFYEMVFYNNGISSEWVPKKGLYNYDPSSDPKNSQRYTFIGTSGINKSGPQLQYEDELTLKSANELKIGSYVYMRCASVDGKKLNASYTSYGEVKAPELQTLPYGQKPVITFKSDGTFNDEGLFNKGFILDPQPAPGSGTYELKNFSIIMKYTDGRTRQCSIHGIFSKELVDCDKIFLEGLDINKM